MIAHTPRSRSSSDTDLPAFPNTVKIFSAPRDVQYSLASTIPSGLCVSHGASSARHSHGFCIITKQSLQYKSREKSHRASALIYADTTPHRSLFLPSGNVLAFSSEASPVPADFFFRAHLSFTSGKCRDRGKRGMVPDNPYSFLPAPGL